MIIIRLADRLQMIKECVVIMLLGRGFFYIFFDFSVIFKISVNLDATVEMRAFLMHWVRLKLHLARGIVKRKFVLRCWPLSGREVLSFLRIASVRVIY